MKILSVVIVSSIVTAIVVGSVGCYLSRESTGQLRQAEGLEGARKFCDSYASTDGIRSEHTKVYALAYVENDDGQFVDCTVGLIDGPAGAHVFGKNISGMWKKIWSGNGDVDQQTIDTYSIPYQFIS